MKYHHSLQWAGLPRDRPASTEHKVLLVTLSHITRDVKVTANVPSNNFSEVTLVISKSQRQPL